MSERDPRTDPRKGDVVRNRTGAGIHTRRVVDCRPTLVAWEEWGKNRPRRGEMIPEGWVSWARGGTVLAVAGKKTGAYPR